MIDNCALYRYNYVSWYVDKVARYYDKVYAATHFVENQDKACKKGKDSKEKNLKEKEDFEQNAAHQ